MLLQLGTPFTGIDLPCFVDGYEYHELCYVLRSILPRLSYGEDLACGACTFHAIIGQAWQNIRYLCIFHLALECFITFPSNCFHGRMQHLEGLHSSTKSTHFSRWAGKFINILNYALLCKCKCNKMVYYFKTKSLKNVRIRRKYELLVLKPRAFIALFSIPYFYLPISNELF